MRLKAQPFCTECRLLNMRKNTGFIQPPRDRQRPSEPWLLGRGRLTESRASRLGFHKRQVIAAISEHLVTKQNH